MKKIRIFLFLCITISCIAVTSCRQTAEKPKVPIYTFPPQENQPDVEPEPDIPVIPSPQESDENYIVRNIVVDGRNNIFSIGIPAGQTEETEVAAEKPVDFWFEYLPAEVKLEVNGEEIQRDPFHWETKLKYTTSVTKFEYRVFNTTGQYISYNLYLVPSANDEAVPVIVRQRWIP
jgi:hypothetical protein